MHKAESMFGGQCFVEIWGEQLAMDKVAVVLALSIKQEVVNIG